MVHVSL